MLAHLSGLTIFFHNLTPSFLWPASRSYTFTSSGFIIYFQIFFLASFKDHALSTCQQHWVTFLVSCLRWSKAARQPNVFDALLGLKTLPSVLPHSWLGVRKNTRPVKKWVTRCWRGYLSTERGTNDLKWSSWCHRHPIISCFIKTRNGLSFLCRLTQVVLEVRPLNGCC